MKKLISVLLVLLMLATPLYVFAAEEDEAVHQGSYEEYFENFNLARAKNATPGEDVIKPPMATKPYSSALLSAIINAMKSGKSNVSIESYKVKTSEINDVMAAVYSAYPLEYTAARLDYYGWSYYTSSNVITKINLYYYSDKLTYAKRYAALKAVVDEITGSIPTGATEFEKVLAVHDWLVYNCQYDLTYSIYDGYTILTSKTGVCQAYSEAYKLLMDVLGVECVIATSRQMNHAWNMVRIGGSWYHVDATWDDPVPDTPGQIYYSYFLHSDSDFINSYEHHDWVTDNNIVCSNREYEDLPRGTNSTQHYKNGYWYYIKDGSVWRCDYNGNNPVNLGISANSIAFYGDFMIYSNGQKIYEYNLRTGATTLLYTMQSDECGALPYYAEVSSLNVSNDGILTYKCLAYYPVEGESYYRGRYEPGKNSIILKTSGGAYDTKRLYGNSRVNTSIAVAKYGWTSGSNTAILTNGYNFADALAGGPLAYALDAPIILTANKSVLETEVLDQLQSAGVRKVIILGGTAAVNSNIETQIAAKGYQVERVYGTSRYETAVKIAQKLNEVKGTTARNFFVAAGNNYPDALSVSPA
ncbi:MAG: cell wall-binding repeat-containing protein, partial [Clostridia bacterium]|nr:cell wall-binding repeat-containing protein [Clostridia bacterium]